MIKGYNMLNYSSRSACYMAGMAEGIIQSYFTEFYGLSKEEADFKAFEFLVGFLRSFGVSETVDDDFSFIVDTFRAKRDAYLAIKAQEASSDES